MAKNWINFGANYLSVLRFKLKKKLGQHLLSDNFLAREIVNSLPVNSCKRVLEIGPGMGALTKYLVKKNIDLKVVEIDPSAVELLRVNVSQISPKVIIYDFLKLDLKRIYENQQFSVIGNFPYNISSQIMFKVLDHHNQIPNLVGMFQKEVAQRIIEPPGTKQYGILSVLTQLYYSVENLFDVSPDSFYPKPKVHSSVIRLTRLRDYELTCNKKLLHQIVKMSFMHRRKTLRNSLRSLDLPMQMVKDGFFSKRPEQLSTNDFVNLTKKIESARI